MTNNQAGGLSFRNARALAIFIVVLCVSFVADRVLPLEQFGLRPRSLEGLTGIVAMPLLHADLAHLSSNLVPLILLMAMLIATQPRPLITALMISLLGGALTWLFARNGNHIGASGLVFGLATCLIVGGYRSRSMLAFAAAGITAVVYGTTLLSGVMPASGRVSWDGHLAGAVAGIVVARYYLRPSNHLSR
ncbi:MAG: rhomboid family intramembrane serine protease [Gammaproteobacteria bacterium]